MDRPKALEAVSTCPGCQGTGWVLKETRALSGVVPCPECRSQAITSRLIEQAGIPPRYFDRGFDVYSFHHPLQEKALKRAIEFVEEFPSVDRGLLLVGPCGVGKTHLCVAILRTLIEEKQVRARFVDETELLRRLQYSYQPDTAETEREVLAPLMDADLLVWDDLGTGRPTEWVKETIRIVINYRYTYRKVTLFTTNRSIAQASSLKEETAETVLDRPRRDTGTLSERIGRHLYSRVLEMCEILEVQGPDARTAIHKARLDFRKGRRRPKGTGELAAEASISCPRCGQREIVRQDHSPIKKGPEGDFLEIACLCPKCNAPFLTRFLLQTGKVDYI